MTNKSISKEQFINKFKEFETLRLTRAKEIEILQEGITLNDLIELHSYKIPNKVYKKSNLLYNNMCHALNIRVSPRKMIIDVRNHVKRFDSYGKLAGYLGYEQSTLSKIKKNNASMTKPEAYVKLYKIWVLEVRGKGLVSAPDQSKVLEGEKNTTAPIQTVLKAPTNPKKVLKAKAEAARQTELEIKQRLKEEEALIEKVQKEEQERIDILTASDSKHANDMPEDSFLAGTLKATDAELKEKAKKYLSGKMKERLDIISEEDRAKFSEVKFEGETFEELVMRVKKAIDVKSPSDTFARETSTFSTSLLKDLNLSEELNKTRTKLDDMEKMYNILARIQEKTQLQLEESEDKYDRMITTLGKQKYRELLAIDIQL